MVYCAAFDCNNDSRETKGSVPPIHYHVFPTEESILKQWLAKISRADLVVTKNSRLCSRHFDDECYERDLKAELLGTPRQFRLKPDAVPTKFSHLPESKKRRISSEHRSQKKAKQEVRVTCILKNALHCLTVTRETKCRSKEF